MCEAQSTINFKYADEDEIDSCLKCIICSKPYLDPITVRCCGHILCQSGIKILQEHPNCHRCQEVISNDEWKPINGDLVESLNRLLVKCNYCDRIGIKRGDFNQHLLKLCPKVPVYCSDANGRLNCKWTGPRDQHSNHKAQCNMEVKSCILQEYAHIRKRIDQMNVKIEECRLHDVDIPSNIESLIPTGNNLNEKCTKLELQNQQLKSKMEEFATNTKHLTSQVDDTIKQNKDLQSQIKALSEKDKVLSEKNKALEFEIQEMKLKSKQEEERINNLLSSNQQSTNALRNFEAKCNDLMHDLDDLKNKKKYAEHQTENLSKENGQLKSELEYLKRCEESQMKHLRTQQQNQQCQVDHLPRRDNQDESNVEYAKSDFGNRYSQSTKAKQSHSCVPGAKCVIS